MRTVHKACAGAQRPADHALDAEQPQPDDRARDVDDRIDRADLVEVDLLDRAAVDAGLGLAEALEGGYCALLIARRQVGAPDDAKNVVQVPVRMAVSRALDLHPDLRGGEAAPLDLPRAERIAFERELAELLAEGAGRKARVDQRAEDHVAARAREGIKVGDLQRLLLARAASENAEYRTLK